MKVLVVYFSLTGNVKLIAEKIVEATNADILRLETKKTETTNSFVRHLLLGWQILSKKKPALLEFDIDFSSYDFIFLGTPVWGFTFVPAFRTFFSKVKLSGKKIALFCCHGGGPGKIFEKMKKELIGNEVVDELKLKEPLKKDTEQKCDQATAWAKKMVL